MDEIKRDNPYMITSVDNMTKDEAREGIRKEATRISLALMLLFVFIQGFGFVADKLGLNAANTQLVSFLFNYAVAFPVCLFLAGSGQKNTIKSYFQKPVMTKKEWFSWTCIFYFLTMIINLIGTFIFGSISSLIQKSGGEALNAVDILPKSLNLGYCIGYILAVGILAPLFEELLLRGACLTSTVRYGQWFSFIVVGFAFGLTHGNFQQMFYAMIVGVGLCFIAYKSKSIIPVIATHMFINMPSALLGVAMNKVYDVSEKFEKETGISILTAKEIDAETQLKFSEYIMKDNSYIAFTAVTIIVLFLIVSFFIGLFAFIKKVRYYRDDFICGNTCSVLTLKEKFIAYISAPATIFFLIFIVSFAVYVALPK